jgi:glycosyltransferase involved in cell wall biosynthesis
MRDSSVALCVPAFNAAALLPRLFDSVSRQEVPFDELWVYDDASTDRTAEVAAQCGARVVQGQVNKGCSAGKNALLMQVGASWVHFHDADDTLAPEFVKRAKARIQRNTFDVLLFNYEQVEERSGQQMSRSQFEATDVRLAPVRYMLSNTVNNGGVYAVDLLRRVGGFDEDPAVRYNEDRAFHLRLAEVGAAFEVDPYVGSRFYFNAGSMSSANRVRCLRAHSEITRRFARRHPDGFEREIGRLSWQDAGGLASFLDWREADACVRLAIRHGARVPEEAGALFRSLARIHPLWALRIREHLIRWFKPRFRAGYPLKAASE